MNNNDSIALNVEIKKLVLDVAMEKAELGFNGNINAYLTWLICTNNKKEIKNKLASQKIQPTKGKVKPKMIEGTEKIAIYENTCACCKKIITIGTPICQAEGYTKYIHKDCCEV